MATSLVCVRFGSNSQRHMSAIPESSPPEFACPGNYVASQPSSLRCAKCGRPLDVKDARYTPTGYVCPYYVKARVATFYNAGFVHYLAVGALCFVLGLLIGVLMRLVVVPIPFFSLWITLILAPLLGGGVAELIRRVMRAMGDVRGQHTWLVSAVLLSIGGLLVMVPELSLVLLLARPPSFSLLIALGGVLLAAIALAARLREFSR